MGTPSPTTGFCGVLDALASQSQQDDAALVELASRICQNKTLLLHFLPQPTGYATPRFNRLALAACLQWVRFDQWQAADWLQLTDADSDHGVLHINEQWSLDLAESVIGQPRWMRVVDLALFDVLGATISRPLSPEWLDTQHVTLTVERVARFLKCARFHSWSVDGWAEPTGCVAMRNVLAAPI
jgi:hypothetical protein